MANKVESAKKTATKAPAVVVKKTATVPVARQVDSEKESFSLLDFVAHGKARLPKECKTQKSFFRFLRKACADSMVMEQVERFRDAVLLSTVGAQKNPSKAPEGLTIALSGPKGGEGSSFLSLALAMSLGSCSHHRVAVLDGSFDEARFSALTDTLDLSKNSVSMNKGASEVLGYYNEQQPNVYFLKSASGESDVEFFSDKQLKFFLEDLRQQFDFTIIDMPPMLSGSSGIFLAPAVDRLYMVSSAGVTKTSDIARCVEIADMAGAEISGVVVNGQKAPVWSRAFWSEFFY